MSVPRPPFNPSNLPDFPPLPLSGPPEDSELARQNFLERERVSRSWVIRLFPMVKSKNPTTPLERRESHAVDLHLGGADTPNNESLLPLDMNDSVVHFEGSEISLSNDGVEEDPAREQHLYHWAMIYENQRGISLFSSSRYSSQSLLPRDPPPFSVVAAGSSLIDGHPSKGSKAHQPNVSLNDFPLPDGNWRWASKEWMIDMRDGTVQHDGFEYNWFFRSRNWRNNAGRLNAGAWVRRRRWVRLMERPPLSTFKLDPESPDRMLKDVDTSAELNPQFIWQGDEGDWRRLHSALRLLDRDGRKLEMWKEWLGLDNLPPGSRFRDKQWSEDDEYLPSEIERDEMAQAKLSLAVNAELPKPDFKSVAALFRTHGEDILRLFIFPASRAEFMQLVKAAGLISEFPTHLHNGSLQVWDKSEVTESLPKKPDDRDVDT